MEKIEKLTDSWREEKLMLPIWWKQGKICLIDQKALPFKTIVLECKTVNDLAKAITDMTIRGSGAIGIAGAYGMLLTSTKASATYSDMVETANLLKSTRPTAINLSKTVTEILQKCHQNGEDLQESVEQSVIEILIRQLQFEKQLGAYGAEIINDHDSILTHCHSGAMAGSGFGGRALSVIRSAFMQNKDIHVFVSETRPYLQGARITAFELDALKIPYTLITDSSSGFLMRQGKIQKVVVGSDRVAANGDLINKVGTYMHALAASQYDIPFYTATSSHTIDFNLATGDECEIEYRDSKEVKEIFGIPITLQSTQAIYPSFDVTPHALIKGIITEKGIIEAPFISNLLKVQ